MEFCLIRLCSLLQTGLQFLTCLILLHPERPKLHTILAFLSAIGLTLKENIVVEFANSVDPVDHLDLQFALLSLILLHSGQNCIQFWPF